MRPTRRLLALPIVLMLPTSPPAHPPLDLAAVSLAPADLETMGRTNTAAGAAGFAVTEDGRYDSSLWDVSSVRRFGDQSEISRSVDPATGVPRLNLTFQLGSLVADVWLTDNTAAEPGVATVETLAELFQQRIERALTVGAPNLSTRTLRLQPLATGQAWWNCGIDRYSRIDGTLAPAYWSLIGDLETSATPEAHSPEAATDPVAGSRYDFAAYVIFDSWIQPPTADQIAALSSLNATPIDDGTAETAAVHLAALRRDDSAIPDPTRFSPVPNAPIFGAESFTAKLVINGRLNYSIVGRLGPIIASIYVPIPAVESLMTAQVACVQSPTPCPSLPMPEALMP